MTTETETNTGARLPMELIIIIAKMIAGDLCFRDLANLNVACRAIHQETTPVMYATLYITERKLLHDIRNERRHVCSGMRHVRVLIVDGPLELLVMTVDPFRRLLPSVKLVIIKDSTDRQESRRIGFIPCKAVLRGRVHFATLVSSMLLPLASPKDLANPPDPDLSSARNDVDTSPSYLPEKITEMTLEEDGGLIFQDQAEDYNKLQVTWSAMTDHIAMHLAPGLITQDGESLVQNLADTVKLVFPQSSEISFGAVRQIIKIYCTHDMLPCVADLSGHLPLSSEIKATAYEDPDFTVEAYLDILAICARRYLHARRQYIDQHSTHADYLLTEIDSTDWTGFDDADRKASHNFQMMISPQIHPDPSQPELEGYDADDWFDGKCYLHTVKPSAPDPRGSLELVYSTPGYSYPWFGRKTEYAYDEGGRVL